jgi:hypothetical protein
MVAETRLASRRDRTLAFAAAALLHAIVVFLLIWRLGGTPPPADAPVMNVQLTRSFHKVAPRRTAPPANRPADRSQAPVTAHVTHAPEDRDVAAVPAPPASEPGGDMRRALRGLLGCQPAGLARLSAEARELCQERMAAGGAADSALSSARLNLDLHGRYARDPEPYLNRRPRNGCKARAAGDVSVMGQQGAAAGVDCAWSF